MINQVINRRFVIAIEKPLVLQCIGIPMQSYETHRAFRHCERNEVERGNHLFILTRGDPSANCFRLLRYARNDKRSVLSSRGTWPRGDPFRPLDVPRFSHNPENRCYLCKRGLFSEIQRIARENSLNVVCEGSNLDDDGDYRPGRLAIAELGIRSPLCEASLSKNEIRELSKKLGLSTWEKPSFACLASRFVYGEEITAKKLGMVDRAEQLLFDLGFMQFRVRIHGDAKNELARIEVFPGDFDRLLENREQIVREFEAAGFVYVSMDLTGYRTGSMNAGVGK